MCATAFEGALATLGVALAAAGTADAPAASSAARSRRGCCCCAAAVVRFRWPAAVEHRLQALQRNDAESADDEEEEEEEEEDMGTARVRARAAR